MVRKKIKESRLDKVFSLWVRNRDKKCLKCGKKENLQCAHIYSRVARSVRFEPLNALTLCYACHFGWAHKYPLEFAEFVKDYLGPLKLKELKLKYYSLKAGGFSEEEKQALLEKFNRVNNS